MIIMWDLLACESDVVVQTGASGAWQTRKGMVWCIHKGWWVTGMATPTIHQAP